MPAKRERRTDAVRRFIAEVPAEVLAALRNAVAGPPAARERLVVRLVDASEAYERGRFEEAARRVAPVAEAAPTVPPVRELAGLANYRARRWRSAVAHLRAHADLTGSPANLPALMDAERALRRPRMVRQVYDELVASSPGPDVLSEARIVMAASMADRGKVDEALQFLVEVGAERKVRNPADRHVRQWYALADLYERAGDLPRARELFARVASADPDAYDVGDRLEELGAAAPVARRARRPSAPRRGGG